METEMSHVARWPFFLSAVAESLEGFVSKQHKHRVKLSDKRFTMTVFASVCHYSKSLANEKYFAGNSLRDKQKNKDDCSFWNSLL